MREGRTVRTDRAPSPIGAYSQAAEAAGLVFTAGQIGIDPETGRLPEGIEAQTGQALKNIDAVLSVTGEGLDDVVKLTLYITDMCNFDTVDHVCSAVLKKPWPARSAVEVSALPGDALVEIEAVAMKGRK
ncbi:MAG: RidA family protein [Candidatus Aegiribacteria sp.]|nr:RidA family protein [Candidatus Aegiribacteria sp.]MBD3294185.1 RidA family protein [Candidatus Fermentibacteria bacterium]